MQTTILLEDHTWSVHVLCTVWLVSKFYKRTFLNQVQIWHIEDHCGKQYVPNALAQFHDKCAYAGGGGGWGVGVCVCVCVCVRACLCV